MTPWTAILPLKMGADRKSRLSPVMSFDDRRRLSDQIAEHVIECLLSAPYIVEIIVLSPQPWQQNKVQHAYDQGRGLNAELKGLVSEITGNLLVIHGDLPLLKAGDISAMLNMAEASGAAIAPDRHGQGTNALALLENSQRFDFAFGPGSYVRHCAQMGKSFGVVDGDGFRCDIDTPEDLQYAAMRGFRVSLVVT